MPAVAHEAFSEVIAGLLWLCLLHGLWLGMMSAGLVASLFQCRRTLTNRSRHATLLVALGVVAIGPTLLTACHSLIPARSAIEASGVIASVAINDQRPEGARRDAASPRLDPGASRRANFDWCRDLVRRSAMLATAARSVVLGLWLPSLVGGMMILAFGLVGMNRLRRQSIAATPELNERARRLGRRLGLRFLPSVLIHPDLVEPCLCGLIEPAILLPERWLASAEPATIDAVLAHELAHARRRDPLVNLVQRVLEIGFFFNPGVHWLSASLRRHRELCTDRLAVQITGDPLALARALESVARLRADRRAPRPLVAWLGGESVSLLPRIQELLGMNPHRPRFSVWPFAAVPTALFLAVVTASVGLAREKQAPPSAPPPARPTDDSKEMISFEVRFISIDADTWRDGLKGKVQPLDGDEKAPRWLMDATAFRGLLERSQEQPTTNVIQAPKLTSYEEALATIIRGDHLVDLRGKVEPGAIRMWAEVSKRVLEERNARSRPFSAVSLSRGTYDIPENSSLVVRAEVSERKDGNGRVPQELLVAITPRRIVPEAEEKPMARKQKTEPQPKPSRR